jgi:hypothetical protein
MLWAVLVVPTPAITVALSPTASLTTRRISPDSATLQVGLSPVVPLTATPSCPCSTRCSAMAAVASRSTAPSSVNAVAIAVSIRPKGAGDVMGVRLPADTALLSEGLCGRAGGRGTPGRTTTPAQ